MSSADERILQEFLNAGEAFVSGSRLATILQTSRVSIWSHMEKLRAEGYGFEAKPRLGYRLIKIPDAVSSAYLNAALANDGIELPAFVHDSIDSTNSEADRLLANGQRPPFLVAARTQSVGRGRLGRPWHSNDRGNLYLTFAYDPGLSPERMQTFTLWIGVSLCELLAPRVPEIRIKWPNDLLVHGRKIAGMLTEARIDTDRIRNLVFGLGLNVNGSPETWPDGLSQSATSLAAAAGSPLPLNPFTVSLVQTVHRACLQFIEGAAASRLHEKWKRFDALAGLPVAATINSSPVRGIAEGIDPEGRLLIRTASGKSIKLHAGDVTLRKST